MSSLSLTLKCAHCTQYTHIFMTYKCILHEDIEYPYLKMWISCLLNNSCGIYSNAFIFSDKHCPKTAYCLRLAFSPRRTHLTPSLLLFLVVCKRIAHWNIECFHPATFLLPHFHSCHLFHCFLESGWCEISKTRSPPLFARAKRLFSSILAMLAKATRSIWPVCLRRPSYWYPCSCHIDQWTDRPCMLEMLMWDIYKNGDGERSGERLLL